MRRLSNELRRIQKTCIGNTPSKQGGSLVGAICYNYNSTKRKGKPKMSKMKEYIEIIAANCDECGGAGFLFFGNENSYDVEPCDCIADLSDELNVEWVNK
jgi:hypothetical protein